MNSQVCFGCCRSFFMVFLLSLGALSLSQTLRPSTASPEWGYGSDTTTYLDLAKNLTLFKRFVHSPGFGYPGIGIRVKNAGYSDNLYLMPAFPALLGIFLHSGTGLQGGYLLEYLLFFIMSLVVFATVWRLFGSILPAWLLWTSFIIFQILQPILLLQLQAIGIDLAAACWTAAVIWLLVELVLTSFRQRLLGIGLILTSSAAIATRTNLAAFLLPVFVGTMLLTQRTGRLKKTGWISLSIVAITLILTGFGNHLRELTGRSTLGLNAGYGLYVNYVYSEIPRAEADQTIDESSKIFNALVASGINENRAAALIDRHYAVLTWQFVRSHPSLSLRQLGYNMLRVFIGKDYFWMPRLVFVKSVGESLAMHDDRFHSLYAQTSIPFKIFYQLLNVLFYLLFILTPVAALVTFPIRAAQRNERQTLAPEDALMAIFCASAIVFLFATGLVLAQSRYRLPVLCIGYYALLGHLVMGQASPSRKEIVHGPR
jgi:hypothetical protein